MGNSAQSALRCCVPQAGASGDKDEGGDGGPTAVHRVELAASELFSIPGIGTAYHTSVVVNGEEFFFSDSGIYSDRVLTSHQGKPSEKKQVGFSRWTGAQLCQALEKHFMAGTYDLIKKNCNSFSDCALSFLLKERLDRKYTTLERYGQCVSHDILQRFTDGMYQPNPAAQSFSSDAVVAEVGKLDPEKLAGCAAGQQQRMAALAVGKRVTVVGLRKAPALNGQGAEIVRFNLYNGRWEARVFATGEVKAFRAENLRPAGELVLEPGDVARICGLKSETGQLLNGLECRVVRYEPSASRYEVMVGEELKSLKAENLQTA